MPATSRVAVTSPPSWWNLTVASAKPPTHCLCPGRSLPACGSSGTLDSPSICFLALLDVMWSFSVRLGLLFTALCRCRFLSEAPSEHVRPSVRGLQSPLLCAFPRCSPPRSLSLNLCAPALWNLGVFAGTGGGATFVQCELGGGAPA